VTPTPVDDVASPMDDDLVRTGRYARIETRGRRSGHRRSVTLGFIDDVGDGPGVIVASTGDSADWVQNLLADPRCRVTIADRSFDATAEPLDPTDHSRAVRDLILRYGTPSESLGHGPSFRLRPVGGDPT
jgi:deazaflavin-dependent oxidoreductase (nitroreductase family)